MMKYKQKKPEKIQAVGGVFCTRICISVLVETLSDLLTALEVAKWKNRSVLP